MLKKTIQYKDLFENPIVEDFYFNLTMPEVAELELGMPGGMSAYYQRIVESKDAGALLKSFKDIIEMSYGERDADGKTFNKIDPLTGRKLGQKFLQTDAYSVLFMELFGVGSSDEAFSDFVKQIVPQELVDKIPDNIQLPAPGEAQPAGERTVGEYSRQELLALSDEDFEKLAGTDPRTMAPEVLQVAFQRRSQKQ